MKLRPLTLILVFCACHVLVQGGYGAPSFLQISDVFVSEEIDYEEAKENNIDLLNNNDIYILHGRVKRYLFVRASSSKALDYLNSWL